MTHQPSRRGLLFGLGAAVAMWSAPPRPARALPGRRLRLNRSANGRIAPTTQWGASGAAGSGFGGSNPAAPVDPTRVTAKPRGRWQIVPNQTITGDFTVMVAASAKGGIAGVRYWLEGNSLTTTNKVAAGYIDANNNTVNKVRRGYKCVVDYATVMALNATGSMRIYAEIFAKDGSMQTRVLGPLLIHARAPGVGPGLQYDASLTIDPTQPQAGTNYQTLQAALLFCKNNTKIRPLMTVMQTCTLDLGTSLSSTFNSVGTWAMVTAAPGVTAQMVATSAGKPTSARLKYGGLHFAGAGILFKPDQFTQLFAENGDDMWLDGCRFVGAGQFALFGDTKTVPQTTLFQTNARYWCTDVVLSDYYNGLSNAELLLGCSLSRMAGDAIQNVKCAQNCTVDTMGTGALRDPSLNPSIQITNNTGSTVSISVTGAANSSTRTITVTVGGTPNALAVDQVTTGANWRFSDFQNFLVNTLGGFAVTLPGSDAMRLVYMQMAGATTPTTGPFNGGAPLVIANGATATIGACYDDHADVNQNFSSGGVTSNVIVQYNRFSNIGTDIQTLFLDHTASNFQDCDWSFNLVRGGLRSFVNSPAFHVTFARNTFPDAPFNWVASNSAMTSTTATIVGNVLTIPGTLTAYKYLAVGMAVTGAGVTAGTTVASITHQFDGTNTVATLNNGGMNVGPGVTITIQPSGENFQPDAYCEFSHNAFDTAAWTLAASGAPIAAGIDQNFIRSGADVATATNSLLGGGAAWTTFVTDAVNGNYAPQAGKMIVPDGGYAGAFVPGGAYNEAA